MGSTTSNCGGDRSKDDGEKTQFFGHAKYNMGLTEVIDDNDYEALSLKSGKANTGYFGLVALVTQALLTTCFFFADYNFTNISVFDSAESYNFWVGSGVWIFVGMGYIMTFLKFYGLAAVGSTLFIGSIGLQWALLLQGWMTTESFHLDFDIHSFIMANYGIAAVLVSFGAVLGKTTPLQILFMVLMEMPCYVASKNIIMEKFGVQDVGGTISVHVFGAFFGVACAAFMMPKEICEDNYSRTYGSDLLSMLGTVFMWLFWPCFVAGSLTAGSAQQKMALMNCCFALLGSTVTVFAATTLLSQQRLKLKPIQMATLAGGVAIGGVANFAIIPGGAVLIGMGAGLLSTVMFTHGDRGIPSRIDTCSVMSLHGVPGLYGGLISILLPYFVQSASINSTDQALGLLAVLAHAVVGGGVVGLILKRLTPAAVAYNDEAYWDSQA